MTNNSTPAFIFENALQQLEALVEKIETGQLNLEESMLVFEQGVALTRSCQKALSDAEQKVHMILEDSAGIKSQPFDAKEAEKSVWPWE